MMWPLKLMRLEGMSWCGHRSWWDWRKSWLGHWSWWDWRGCRDVASEIDETGSDVRMWPPMLMRLEWMSWCRYRSWWVWISQRWLSDRKRNTCCIRDVSLYCRELVFIQEFQSEFQKFASQTEECVRDCPIGESNPGPFARAASGLTTRPPTPL